MATSVRPDNIHRLPPKARELWDLAPYALGEAWQYRLAQIREVGLKTVSRWSLGEREVPDDAIAMLHGMAEKLHASPLHDLLREVEAISTKEDVDPRVVSALLTDLANRLKPTRKVPSDKKYKSRTKTEESSDASTTSE